MSRLLRSGTVHLNEAGCDIPSKKAMNNYSIGLDNDGAEDTNKTTNAALITRNWLHRQPNAVKLQLSRNDINNNSGNRNVITVPTTVIRYAMFFNVILFV